MASVSVEGTCCVSSPTPSDGYNPRAGAISPAPVEGLSEVIIVQTYGMVYLHSTRRRRRTLVRLWDCKYHLAQQVQSD